jgi:hypothetical protein
LPRQRIDCLRIEILLKVRNQLNPNPVSQVLRVSITRVFPVACLSDCQVLDDVLSGGFQERADEKIVQNGMNARESLEPTSSDQAHQNGLSLIVQGVAQGDPGCPHPFRCSSQEGVANFSRGILKVPSGRSRSFSDLQLAGDKPNPDFTTELLDKRLIFIRLLSSKGVIQVCGSQLQTKAAGQFTQAEQESRGVGSPGNGNQHMFAAFQHSVFENRSFDLDLERRTG